MSQETERGTAARGEANRLEGNYSESIRCFTAVLADPRTPERRRPWLRAHRGAAYGAMCALKEASDDLRYAIDARKDRYPWALAHLGEAHRVYVLSYMATLTREALGTHIWHAIGYFNEAVRRKADDPWMYAHRGATYAQAYWVARRLQPLDTGTPSVGLAELHPEVFDARARGALDEVHGASLNDPTKLAAHAEADLQKAFALTPGYAWAYALHAFLLVLKNDLPTAMQQLGKAQAYDVNLRMNVQMLGTLAKLFSYQHDYANSVNAAWLALQKNPGDVAAAYFAAVGLSHLEDPSAKLAIQRARQLLDSAQSGIDYMRLGLRQLDGPAPTREEVEAVLKKGDLEVKELFFHDPAWLHQKSGWREKTWESAFEAARKTP